MSGLLLGMKIAHQVVRLLQQFLSLLGQLLASLEDFFRGFLQFLGFVVAHARLAHQNSYPTAIWLDLTAVYLSGYRGRKRPLTDLDSRAKRIFLAHPFALN